MVACLNKKKTLTETEPYDFQLGALSVGPDVVNDSPFRALSLLRRVKKIRGWTENLTY